ncbi:TIGR01777 family oxidoreductase [Gilvimarinus agarilyticus]|uniref:TIGR01777 family oxidoreductase n=1 Tax=Gilvimarinus agarilyticus TaxID=679259 RepID=UPI0005A10FA4|nr:TIGR01777 family oxidoreductase [Gilvimarinus agarilyticus]
MKSINFPGCRILVTGGTGFIGHLLCRELCQIGAEVTVLTRSAAKARQRLAKLPVAVIDMAGIAGCERFDGVINLAGATVLSRWSVKRQRVLRDSRITFTHNLLHQLDKIGAPAVLVSGSAIGFYGDTADATATEATARGEGFAAQLCADWEAQALASASRDTRVCLLRTGIVLDRDGGALGSMLPAFRLGLGGPIAGGQQWMSWIHRQDLVSLIIWLLGRQDVSGPINAVAPMSIRNVEFASTLGNVLRRPTVLPVPGWVLKLLVGQAAQELLLSSNRVAPQVAIEAGFEYRYSDLIAALKVSV